MCKMTDCKHADFERGLCLGHYKLSLGVSDRTTDALSAAVSHEELEVDQESTDNAEEPQEDVESPTATFGAVTLEVRTDDE